VSASGRVAPATVTSSCSLSIVSDTSRIGEAIARIKEIVTLARSGDASASKTTKRIERLLASPARAVSISAINCDDPWTLRVSYAPTPHLLALISTEKGA
jgi:hypothetical protein